MGKPRELFSVNLEKTKLYMHLIITFHYTIDHYRDGLKLFSETYGVGQEAVFTSCEGGN